MVSEVMGRHPIDTWSGTERTGAKEEFSSSYRFVHIGKQELDDIAVSHTPIAIVQKTAMKSFILSTILRDGES